MPDLSTLAGFALTSLLIELTPGPNMAYLAILAATEGRKAAFAAVAGVCLGLAIVAMAAALGLAALIANSAVAYQAVRWAGVGYLLWLAWQDWRGAAEPNEFSQAGSLAQYFRRGLITNLLNPKVAVFYLAVMPAFLRPEAAISDVLALSTIYVGVATLVHALIVIASGTARHWLEDPVRAKFARRISALALVGVAAWMILKT